MRGYKEQGNINTPLELAIRNQTDRFSLAIDAIDRMPRFRVTGVERSRGPAQPADRVQEPRLGVRHRSRPKSELAVAVQAPVADDPPCDCTFFRSPRSKGGVFPCSDGRFSARP